MSLLDEELALPRQSEVAYVEKLTARFSDKQYEVRVRVRVRVRVSARRQSRTLTRTTAL